MTQSTESVSDGGEKYYQLIADRMVSQLYEAVQDESEGRYEAFVEFDGRGIDLLDNDDGEVVFDRDSEALDGIRVCLNSSDDEGTVKSHIWMALEVNAGGSL